MDFVFGLQEDSDGNTSIVVFADHLSKMAHLAAVPDSSDSETKSSLFIDREFRHTVCRWKLARTGILVSRV